MKAVSKFVFFALLCLSLQAQNVRPSPNAKPNPQRFVVVGDSLSAGVEDFSLEQTLQPHGYASVIASQAGWNLTLPLVPSPGYPNKLELASPPPPVVITQAPGSLLLPPAGTGRVYPNQQATNIAVPGLTVGSALTLRPTLNITADTPAQQVWATLVLGFPSLLNNWAPTEMELAKYLNPTLVIEWLGNNDALVPALAGQINALTPVSQFAVDYEAVLDKLPLTRARLVTATIPDVTEIPFFISVPQIAAQVPGATTQQVAAALGIGLNDYVRITGQDIVTEILNNPTLGPITARPCPSLPGLGVPSLPCVLTEADAKTIRARVNCYNLIISVETALHGGVVVDINKLVNNIYANGYTIPNTQTTLATTFLGGLFSLDGIHPSNTGYAIIANEFIRTMDARLGLKIPPLTSQQLLDVLHNDPLYLAPGAPAGTTPPNPGPVCGS